MALVLFTEQYCSECNIKLLHGNISNVAIKKLKQKIQVPNRRKKWNKSVPSARKGEKEGKEAQKNVAKYMKMNKQFKSIDNHDR